MFERVSIGALVFAAGVAHAQSEGVASWLERCRARVDAVRAVEGRLSALFDEQRELRDAITARKASRDGGGPELQALLESSLRLEAQLESGLDTRETLRARTAADCDRGIAEARSALRRLQPGLRTGPMTERRQVARRMQALRDQLFELQELRRVLAPPRDDVGLSWSDLPLEADPLDGPEDLVEKADFVEDARDRLRERRRMLAALYTQSRQAKALRRAARDFVTDIQIFDESARSPQTGGGASVTADSGSGSGSGSGQESEGPGGNGGGDGSGAGIPGIDDGFTGSGDGDPAPVGQDGGRGSGGFEDVDGGGGGGSIPPSFIADPGRAPAPDGPSAPEVDAGGLVSGASPSFLLNLRVEELEDQNLDLETLEKLLADMARLDDVLGARAVEMRMKAKELGRTESP